MNIKRIFLNLLPDRIYLKFMYRHCTGKKLNLKNPQTFNEKLQWLKLHDRNPEYSIMVDKYAVKQYIANKVGVEYVIPTLGVWDNPDDIDFAALPDQFVLKCTHNSGLGMCICRDKSKLDIKEVKKQLHEGLKQNYYLLGREWPYKNVPRRIIAEKYMEEKGKLVPEDYKIYCFNGKPKYIVVFHNRFDESKQLSETVYDLDWNPQNISLDEHFAISDIVIPRPECLEELVKICSILCKDSMQMRVDFYVIENRIYFGEITLYTASGFQKMIPEDLDKVLGAELEIDEKYTGGGYKARANCAGWRTP